MADEFETYFVLFKEDSEGCDYTIGCGTKVVSVSATSMEDAFYRALDDIGWEPDIDYWSVTNPEGYDMKSITVLQVGAIDSDIFLAHKEKMRQRTMQERHDQQEAKDYQEYQRLSAKFKDRE